MGAQSAVRLPAAVWRRATRYYRRVTSRVNKRIIMVVAHPRSGTTVVARLLAEHCGLRAFTETGSWTRADEDIVASRTTVAQVIAKHKYEFSFDVMSAADAGSFLPALKLALPRMRTVFLVRDPRDVVCSVIERINDYDVSSIQIKNPSYRYFNVGWLGIQERDPVRKLALRWNKWLELANEVDDVCYRRYEDFMDDKAGFIRELADRFGLVHHADISGEMDRQMSKHGKPLPIRGVGRWKEMLPPKTARMIEETCATWMQRFGYR